MKKPWWWKNALRVIVVGPNKTTRTKLVGYFCAHLEKNYARNRHSIISKARDIADVHRKIYRKVNDVQLIIFAQDFSEAEKDKLREQLTGAGIAPLFITVPLVAS